MTKCVAYNRFGRAIFTLREHVAAQSNAATVGVRHSPVLNVAGSQRAGSEAVSARIDRGLSRFDHRSLKVGVAVDANFKAAVTRADARLFGHAGEVAFGLDLAGVYRGAGGRPEGDGASEALLCAVVLAGVLQAF